jgi:hypothetical protein
MSWRRKRTNVFALIPTLRRSLKRAPGVECAAAACHRRGMRY